MEKLKKEVQSETLAEAPDVVQFTDLERLEMENIQLKMVLAQQEFQRLSGLQAAWAKKVSDRIGVPEFNRHYAINIAEGVAKKLSSIPNSTDKAEE